MKPIMNQIQIPSKRRYSGYQGSHARCERGDLCSDWANLTAECVQNTSQHENAKAIVATTMTSASYGLIPCFSYAAVAEHLPTSRGSGARALAVLTLPRREQPWSGNKECTCSPGSPVHSDVERTCTLLSVTRP